MAVSFFRLEGQITGGPTGPKGVSFSYVSTAGYIDNVNLATGSNAITFPSGSEGLMLIPPSTNTVALTLKGVTGDTGVLLHATNPTIICVSSSGTSIVVSAASAVTGMQVVVF